MACRWTNNPHKYLYQKEDIHTRTIQKSQQYTDLFGCRQKGAAETTCLIALPKIHCLLRRTNIEKFEVSSHQILSISFSGLVNHSIWDGQNADSHLR